VEILKHEEHRASRALRVEKILECAAELVVHDATIAPGREELHAGDVGRRRAADELAEDGVVGSDADIDVCRQREEQSL